MAVVKVTDLAYVRVRSPDLKATGQFLTDFGLIEVKSTKTELRFRGLGPEPEILIAEAGDRGLAAIGFAVAAREELDRFAATVQAEVCEHDGLGGGWRVAAHDPDGNRIELVCGVAQADPLQVPGPLMNEGRDRLRRRGEVRRPQEGPSHVLRLGHIVLTTPRPEELARWYREMFGFLVSDVIYQGNKDNVLLSFNRLDRGEEYVDHHVFQTLAGPPGGIHHISFEVLDIDDLYVGNTYLSKRGYRHMWGIGRHKQGSQIFDYWIEPSGIMYEHWTDTDLLNAEWTPGVEPVDATQGPWGPPPPPDFITQVG